MSQLAAPSRAPRSTRASSRPARTTRRPAPASRAAAIRPVRARTETVAGKRPVSGFMALVFVFAFVSALSLLLLNTMRAEQSFTLNKLRSDVATLDDRQQGLDSEISAVSAPEHLAVKAEEYGMVRAEQVRYVNRTTGKQVGVATSGQAGQRLSVNTLSTTPASKAAADVLDSGTIGLHITDPVAKAKAAADAKAKADAAKAKAEADAKAKQAKSKDAKAKGSDAKSDATSTTGK
ncbi:MULTISPECIES: hypothetical protein [unclassified Dermacoccus]|uniref:hypothetical protein n=1 Tax=unclassified Dermacoccus TaxID=2643059 RepID=UPI00197ABEE1|nr:MULTISPECIES: hypothetical protein [unclassified Dermacoccus]MBE7371924.1 hypothetical protein [Dermacoccus barathri]MBZ4498348.1 hypothetical protein [Dermacoccus sp. Tok2021]